MGIFNWFKNSGKAAPRGGFAAEAPSKLYNTAMSGMIAALEWIREHGGNGWVVVKTTGPSGTPITLEISGTKLNFLHEEPELAKLLDAEGLGSLAGIVTSPEPGLFNLPDASFMELAAASDVVLRSHFGMTGNYSVMVKVRQD